MKAKRRRRKMDTSLIILFAIVLSLMVIASYTKGIPVMLQGLGKGWNILTTVGVRLLLGFSLAGLMQVVIPSQYISNWIGPESGVLGVLAGAFAGSLMPGGPYVLFPLIGGLYQQGAGVGSLMALVTSWSVTSFNRLLVWEIPMLGARIAILRFVVSIFLPPVVGVLCNLAFYRIIR